MSIVFIISAPSGSGKSTLVQRLMDCEDNLEFSTSVTTRAPRPGDVDGKSYDFVSQEEFSYPVELYTSPVLRVFSNTSEETIR